jgi:hypothetical protein
MKKVLIQATVLFSVIIVLFSCVTTRITNVQNPSSVSSLNSEKIEILGHVEGTSPGARLWVTFIPLGWGRDSWCESRAYKKALKKYPNADGIMDQVLTYYRMRIPLVVLTPVYKSVTLKGVAYRLKTDEEMNSAPTTPARPEE